MDKELPKNFSPFAVKSVDENSDEAEVKKFIADNKPYSLLFLTPPFPSTSALDSYSLEGAHFLVDSRAVNTEEEDQWINNVQFNIFFWVFSKERALNLLEKNASLFVEIQEKNLEDNIDTDISLRSKIPVEELSAICKNIKGNSKVKVSSFKYSEKEIKVLLENKVSICFTEKDHVLSAITRYIKVGKESVRLIHPGFSLFHLNEFIHEGAMVLMTGAPIPFFHFKNFIDGLIMANQPLKVLPAQMEKYQVNLDLLKDLEQEGKIELCDNEDYFFNTAKNTIEEVEV